MQIFNEYKIPFLFPTFVILGQFYCPETSGSIRNKDILEAPLA